MTYILAIGDRTHSSWSLRGWLLLERFGLPVTSQLIRLYSADFQSKLAADFAPSRQVPALKTPEGWVVGETVAIAETLAERHPEAGHWPMAPEARARARFLVAEMHAGFRDLRNDCPMHLAKSYQDSAPGASVLADLARLESQWAMAKSRFGRADSPWLFGDYSAADAFYAPVATRIATYNLPVGPEARAYVTAHLSDPAFRRWRAMGRAENFDQPVYRRPYAERPWPGPLPIPARAVAGPSVNQSCPYSGKPVTQFMEAGGRIWGFCNAFCRDKTMADPEAWPAFMEIYLS